MLLSGVAFAADTDPAKEIFTAIRNNDLPGLKTLLADRAKVNVRGDRDTTPLIYAAAYGTVDAMKLLLDAGADVNAKNALDYTALMWGVTEPAKAKLLTGRGADVNAKSKTGRTALMIASLQNGSDSVVEMLLAKGADARALDKNGLSFLLAASAGMNTRQVRMAVEKGADVNAKNGAGFTPLMNAAAAGDVETVKFLLSKGADVNAVSNQAFEHVKNGPIALGNFTALILAAAYGPAEIVDLLLRAGAKVDARDVRGMTPLHLAVGTEAQNPAIVRLLLKAGAEPGAKTATGETVAEWAAKYNSPEVVKLLPAARRTASETSPGAKPAASSREAVTRSLSLLQKISNSFLDTGGCISCHAQNLTAVANRYAQAHGIPIDVQAQQGTAMGLKSFFSGSRDGLVVRLDPPGSMDTIDYTLFHLSAAGIPGDATTDSLVHNLAAQQMTNGSWHDGGVARAPMTDSDITRTALSLRALKMYSWPARQADLSARVEAGRKWLLRAKPVFNEEHAMQLLGLAWAGDRDTAKFARDLAAQQRPDGGWGQNPYLPSDAYATGETLVALAESDAAKSSDAVFQRGVQYLLSTQHEDGSWHVKSRAPKFQPYFQSGFPYGHDQWISMAGTAWATMALSLVGKASSLQPAF